MLCVYLLGGKGLDRCSATDVLSRCRVSGQMCSGYGSAGCATLNGGPSWRVLRSPPALCFAFSSPLLAPALLALTSAMRRTRYRAEATRGLEPRGRRNSLSPAPYGALRSPYTVVVADIAGCVRHRRAPLKPTCSAMAAVKWLGVPSTRLDGIPGISCTSCDV